LTALRGRRSETSLALIRALPGNGTTACIASRTFATIKVARAASGLKRCVRSSVAAEEMLVTVRVVWNRAGARLPVRRLETLMRRRHGVHARHYAGLTERARVDSRLLHRHAALAELIAPHGTDSGAHTFVPARAIDVRESARAFPQRTDAAEVIMNVSDVDHVHVSYAAAVPREKTIARSAGQPAHASEAAKAEAEIHSPPSSAEAAE